MILYVVIALCAFLLGFLLASLLSASARGSQAEETLAFPDDDEESSGDPVHRDTRVS